MHFNEANHRNTLNWLNDTQRNATTDTNESNEKFWETWEFLSGIVSKQLLLRYFLQDEIQIIPLLSFIFRMFSPDLG